MLKKGRWLLVLGMMLALVSLSSCHIRDATVTFANALHCGLITCLNIKLTLTSQDYPFHVVTVTIPIDSSATVVMDSGRYVWNHTGSICTGVTSGTITISAGTSRWAVGCTGMTPF